MSLLARKSSGISVRNRVISPSLLRRLVGTAAIVTSVLGTSASTATMSSALRTTTSDSAPSCDTPLPEEMQKYRLLQRESISDDSCSLKFELPKGRKFLGFDPILPTCMSVLYNDSKTTDEENMVSEPLKKSYSPISHPSTADTFELLVKSYPYRPGGGVGAYLFEMKEGESMLASVKAKRIIHGSPVVHQRWKHVGLVAGGTGIAPLYQLIRIWLREGELDDSNNNTKTTTIRLLSINRNENDILLKPELDQLEKEYGPDRFSVTYSITGEDNANYESGRGGVEMALKALPPPSNGDGSTMIFICGKDGFVSHWGGPVGRASPPPGKKKGPKIQGPLLGVLNDAGYSASEVFKY